MFPDSCLPLTVISAADLAFRQGDGKKRRRGLCSLSLSLCLCNFNPNNITRRFGLCLPTYLSTDSQPPHPRQAFGSPPNSVSTPRSESQGRHPWVRRHPYRTAQPLGSKQGKPISLKARLLAADLPIARWSAASRIPLHPSSFPCPLASFVASILGVVHQPL